ncbi:vacuolar protein sorting-associated protein 13B-like, partial [Sinocyclocheilus rhinocerous]|uniref:vacuolar protein sorting-associated protein 13B-like n=1 Tax=Sinocyclocheilus rhinocerous TaxID=307959 RepID=UPI0007B8D85B
MVVGVEMEAHAARPSLTLSVSAMTGALTLKNAAKPADGFKEVCLSVQCEDVLVRTGLKDKSAVFVGPFSCSVDLEAHWCRHSGSSAPDSPGPPRVLIDMKGGLLQVFWGQQQFNCLSEIQEQLQNYWNQMSRTEAESNEKPLLSTPPPTPRPAQSEHSSDDLRTGIFQYIQDSACQKLPSPHEVVFWRETDESPGVMLWRYPEPRVITFLRITPAPFNTTDDPDISTADLGDALQNGVLDAEEVVFSHYVICNDTQEVLRFGQVDTDENILLQSNQSHQYSWRTHKSPQVVFSPLFMMWSHLPDPVLVHVEKRSLGHRDTQLIHGRGHQEALLNVEEDLTHHLTFQ